MVGSKVLRSNYGLKYTPFMLIVRHRLIQSDTEHRSNNNQTDPLHYLFPEILKFE